MNAKRIQRLLEMAHPLCLDIKRQKKHISIILRKGRIVSIGCNRFKTHPRAKEKGYMFEEMHSELDAFLKLDAPERGLVLFNVRFNNLGQMRMARPCERCMPWCVGAFSEIWYTTDEGVMVHGESLLPLNIVLPNQEKHSNEEVFTIS
jgi:hypothetical protein